MAMLLWPVLCWCTMEVGARHSPLKNALDSETTRRTAGTMSQRRRAPACATAAFSGPVGSAVVAGPTSGPLLWRLPPPPVRTPSGAGSRAPA